MWFTPEEWKSFKIKLTQAAPKLLLVLSFLVVGYWSGWQLKGADIMMDCKYAQAIRIGTDSFTCQRKI